MEDTSQNIVLDIIDNQKKFYLTHKTKDVEFRIEQLKKLKDAINKYEKEISDALWQDLHKSYEEAYLTEISIVNQEIDFHLKNIKKWSKIKKVSTPFQILPSKSRIIFEPLGIALIIAPWNYPFQLLMNPLVGAISSGCCAVLKPSPYTPTIAKVMENMIKEIFNPNYIGIVQGGRKVNEFLLKQRFDFIFYTGSPAVGKVVMEAASKHLTPVVLELGGKSPCIVDKEADLDKAAMRIAWGKTINAGQTCIAPDYIFAHSSIKDKLIEKIGLSIEKMFTKDIKNNKYYPRIVNPAAFIRLKNLMNNGKIVYGGDYDEKEKYIQPTIIDEIKPDFPIMKEEIFGPLLPVLTFNDIDEVLEFVNTNEKPLAFYYFGECKKAKEVLLKTTSGGGCINDTILHIANHKLPFGGVGNSGLGKYHGYESFLAFSNRRAIVSSPNWIDLPFKYAPYKYFKYIKKII